MKNSIVVIFLFVSSVIFAQTPKTVTPAIVIKAPLDKVIVIDGIQVLFKTVISDSRCPKDVNCIWAGEIKILVNIKQTDNIVAKEITFGGLYKENDPEKVLFESQQFTLRAETVDPYPAKDTASIGNKYVLMIRKVNKG